MDDGKFRVDEMDDRANSQVLQKLIQAKEVGGNSYGVFYIIGIIVVAIAVGAFILWKHNQLSMTTDYARIIKRRNGLALGDASAEELNQLMIQLEQLPVDAIQDDTKLMEIADSKILARVNNLVPGLFQIWNTTGNAIQSIQTNGQIVYQAIIPTGAKLANSKEISGAVRGIYRNAEGISGHANFVAVQQNANVAANVASSAMGVASMVVGQYYMTQIDAKLEEINTEITKISDFQDNEYKSKVFALVAQIQKVAKFQVDILDNNELRLSERDNLNRWETECIQLLGQSNLTIEGYAKKKELDYEEYEKEVTKAQNWFLYQRTLMEVMTRIADLKHILHLGSVSREQCGALLPTYAKQVQRTVERLSEWHQSHIKKLKINIDANNRKRMGFDGAIHFIPGLINESNKFRSISDSTMNSIVSQTNSYKSPQNIDAVDLFKEDVRIIAKEGKVYYLPQDI